LLSLAAVELRRLHNEVDRLSAEAAPVAVVTKAPAVKCRHEFPAVVPGKEGPEFVYRCVKCDAPKKANGRPKKSAGDGTAVAPAAGAPS